MYIECDSNLEVSPEHQNEYQIMKVNFLVLQARLVAVEMLCEIHKSDGYYIQERAILINQLNFLSQYISQIYLGGKAFIEGGILYGNRH